MRNVLRRLLKYPFQSAVAIFVVAIGIGLTAAMISIVDGALFRGLPFEQPDQLLRVEMVHRQRSHVGMPLRPHEFVAFAQRQRSFAELAGVASAQMIVSDRAAGAERYEGAWVSTNTFRTLGARPALGRDFLASEGESGAPPVAIISHRLWTDRLGAAPDIVGKTLRLDGSRRLVVGVMPPGFGFPISTDIWLPLTIDPGATPASDGLGVVGIGRLRPGSDAAQAASELDHLAAELERQYAANRDMRTAVNPYVRRVVGEQLVSLGYVMLAAVFAMLLIAALNVANLLLARTVDRSREVAIRCALGARRRQIVLLLLAESFGIFLVGGVLAVGVAWGAVELFNGLLRSSSGIPFWIDIRMDSRVMLAIALLILICALLAGLIPGLHASRERLLTVLQDASRGSTGRSAGRFQRVLIVAEIALSCALLVPAGLLVKSVSQLDDAGVRLDAGSITVARLLRLGDVPAPDFGATFGGELLRRLTQEPGVTGAAFTTAVPGVDGTNVTFTIEGADTDSNGGRPRAAWAAVSPNFFEVFGVQMQQGRGFRSTDDANSLPVAIVNQSFVRRHLAGRDALGTRIVIGGGGRVIEPRTIVGVVPDLLMNARRPRTGIVGADPSGVYSPLAQELATDFAVTVRTRGSTSALAESLRRHVSELDPDVVPMSVESLAAALDRANAFYVVFSSVFGMFGAVALLLASLGLYGVMAFSVATRTQEIGVRVALGANSRSVLRLVVSQGMRFLILGTTLGLVLAMIMAHALRVILFQVQAWDSQIFLSVATVLTLTGLAACLIPATRALQVAPIVALRNE